MSEVYLAYFDYLGFKEFIENNADEEITRRMNHIFRDQEDAIGQGKYQKPINGLILSDLTNSKVNCLNISDTVLFWTNQCDWESLCELIKVSYRFNWMQNNYNFPVRGALVKGKVKLVSGKQSNSNGGSYSVQCLYGKGLIEAHNKAENQDWAGTVFDNSIIEDLEKHPSGLNFLKGYAIEYKVPYKVDNGLGNEYVLRLVKGLKNPEAVKNTKECINGVFSLDNKSIEAGSVKRKITNTLNFIDALVEY